MTNITIETLIPWLEGRAVSPSITARLAITAASSERREGKDRNALPLRETISHLPAPM